MTDKNPGMSNKAEHNMALLRTLTTPPKGVSPKDSCPPVVVELGFDVEEGYPVRRDRARFRMRFTNGLVITGDVASLDVNREP